MPERKRRRRGGGGDGSTTDGATSAGEDTQSVASARTATSRGSALTAKTGLGSAITGATAATEASISDQDYHITHRSKVEADLTVTFTNGTRQTFQLRAAITQARYKGDIGEI